MFNSPQRCLFGRFHSDKYFKSYVQVVHRNLCMISWKLIVSYIGCEQACGIHTSHESCNAKVGVMFSNRAEYLE